jgi:nucleotide-binding universal stress UspA family protein
MTYRIVVGVDGSAHSNAALEWALAEAESRSGEITALFSWQVPFLGFPGAFDKGELEETAKKFLNETVSSVAPSPAVPLRPVVAEGDPTESLVTASKDAELLVLGIRGRSPFTQLLLGSVSQGCAAAAHCPVVLVKRSDEDQAGE